jgi:hypothetical protein
MTATQPELPIRTDAPLFTVKPGHPNVAWLLSVLQHGRWMTAAEILKVADKFITPHNKRWVRALADASGGRVAGGQEGYKLIQSMTAREYQHWRNWMNSQANQMKSRVIEADRVFYSHAAVSTDAGILTPTPEPDYAI